MRGGRRGVSASIRRRRVGWLDRPPRAAPHRRSDGAPASPLRYSARARAARLSPARREQAGDGLSSLHVLRHDEVRDEWDVACAALNLRRLRVLGGGLARPRAARGGSPRSGTAQHGSGGAVGAPMRRRTGRSLPDPCPAAPNRSGDGAPAPVHGSLGSRSWSTEESPSRACRYYKGSSLLHAWRAQACAVPFAAALASWLQCTEWPPGISRTVTTMLHYAVVFFIIAVIAAALGFRGIAGMSADIGWVFAMLERPVIRARRAADTAKTTREDDSHALITDQAGGARRRHRASGAGHQRGREAGCLDNDQGEDRPAHRQGRQRDGDQGGHD